MSASLFRQVFADAMLDQLTMIQTPYPRTDSLLVVLFNKYDKHAGEIAERPAHERPKPVHQLEIQSGSSVIDGERKWRAAYKVMPNFENWLAYFADELIPPEADTTVSYKVQPGESGAGGTPVDAKLKMAASQESEANSVSVA